MEETSQRKSASIANAFLGSGYDVCGQYADGRSIEKKIFDLNKVPKQNIRQIPNTLADYFTVQGESYQEYQRALTAKAGISTKFLLFSGSVESSFSSTDLSIAESGYVSVKLFMRYETWKLQTMSQEYMYPEVLEDFKTRDGKWLIEQYGAGVVMGMDIGGQWSDNYSVSKLYENSTFKVAASMETAYGSFVSGHGSTEISDAAKNEESIASRRVNVTGGDPKYTPDKIDEWKASVQDKPAFMNFTSDGLVAIWDLFPEYKDKLMTGFAEYVKENQLDIKLQNLILCETHEGLKYASNDGLKSDEDIDLYKPETSENHKYVGVNGNSNKVVMVKQLSHDYGAVCEPTKWHQVWNDKGSHRSHDHNCWIPVGPPDYVALGVFCRFGVHHDHRNPQAPPTKEETEGMVVVHKSLVQETDFETDEVWKDQGSGASHELTLGRLPHHALWPSRTTEPSAGILPTKYTFQDKYMAR